MTWSEIKGYVVDGLFVIGGIAVGGPAILVMTTVFAGGV